MGALFLLRSGSKVLGVTLVLASLGAMGVGVFPETTGAVHLAASFITFFFAGVSALVSFRVCEPPMSYFSIAIGLITLLALVLYASGAYLGLGQGGMERMIAYPALVWEAGLGAYLMGQR